MPPRIPKAKVEAAVKALQLYAGASNANACRIGDQQKLYRRAQAKVEAVIKATGVDATDAWEQLGAEARRRGSICPMSGKDI